MNPWLHIPPGDYDGHMSHPDVGQRDVLDQVFADVLSEYQPRSIALIGCATGGGLQHVDPSCTDHVAAIDVNPQYLEITHSRHSRRLPQLKLIEGDVATLELPVNSFDLIHCALVLEYVEPEPALGNMVRWLNANGVLIVVLQLPSADVGAVTQTGYDSLNLLGPLMRLHDPAAIRRLARASGLKETHRTALQLKSGKQFYVGHFSIDTDEQGED